MGVVVDRAQTQMRMPVAPAPGPVAPKRDSAYPGVLRPAPNADTAGIYTGGCDSERMTQLVVRVGGGSGKVSSAGERNVALMIRHCLSTKANTCASQAPLAQALNTYSIKCMRFAPKPVSANSYT